MPYRTFIPDEWLTADLTNEFLMGQVVIECTSGTRPTTGLHAAMVIGETDTHRVLIYDGTDWVDFGAWSSTGTKTWTPAVTQSTSVTATVITGRYLQIGAVVKCWANVSITGSGSSGNPVTVSLPVTADAVHGSGDILGAGLVYDSSGPTNYTCAVEHNSTTTVRFKNDGSGSSGVGGAPAFGLASGDVIRFQAEYIAA